MNSSWFNVIPSKAQSRNRLRWMRWMGCFMGLIQWSNQSKMVAPSIRAIFNPKGRIKRSLIRYLTAEKLMAKNILVPSRAKWAKVLFWFRIGCKNTAMRYKMTRIKNETSPGQGRFVFTNPNKIHIKNYAIEICVFENALKGIDWPLSNWTNR